MYRCCSGTGVLCISELSLDRWDNQKNAQVGRCRKATTSWLSQISRWLRLYQGLEVQVIISLEQSSRFRAGNLGHFRDHLNSCHSKVWSEDWQHRYHLQVPP